jgi:hypothetical protein
MEADYSRLPFPSAKKRNITVKESKKTKNKESLPDYDPGKRTANGNRQGRDTQFRSIDPSFMFEREKRRE